METSLEPLGDSPFTGQVQLAQHVSPGAITQDPYEVYLSTLDSRESRRTQQRCLDAIATLIAREAQGETPSPGTMIRGRWFPWWLLRYEHTSYIRKLLLAHDPAYAPATINKHLAALRGVLKQCWKMRLMDTDAYARAIDIKIVKGSRELVGRDIHPDEMTAMMDACDASEGPIRHRDKALLAVLECTGVRREELADMRIEHYNQRDRKVRVIGKGNKERIVFIHKNAAPHLDAWLAILGTRTGPMFPPINRHQTIYRERHMTPTAIWQIVQKRRKQAGVAYLSTHDFRRTFGGEFLDAGGDLSQLQKLYGHASATTTQRYDRRGERGMRDAVDRMKIVLPEEGPE